MRTFVVSVLCLVSAQAMALDLNSFRAQHRKPPLRMDASLANAAASHASSMANRGALDHAGFMARARAAGGVSAQNVSYGCDSEACAIAQWSRSARHRANMLRGDVSAYGIGSATGANGRRYWVMELGN